MSSETNAREITKSFYEAIRSITTASGLSLDSAFTDEEGVNPGLTIEGIGKLNVPLNDSVKLAEPTAEGVERVDAAKVQFRNAGFQKWVDGTIQRIADTATLGNKDKVRTKFQQLIAFRGPSASPNITEGLALDSNALGLVAISLPSNYEGGQLKLKYNEREEITQNSGQEEFQTSAISWYAEVNATIGPITQGRRVLLLYSLHCDDPKIPRFQPSNPALEKAMKDLYTAGQSACYLLPATWGDVSADKLSGQARFQLQAVTDLSKRLWGHQVEMYLARPSQAGDDDRGYPDEVNLNDFHIVKSELGDLPGNLPWNKNDMSDGPEVGYNNRIFLVIWPLKDHLRFAKQFRDRPDKWNVYMGGRRLQGLYAAKPVTDDCRAMWLRTLIELQLQSTYRWESEQDNWKKFWSLTEAAIVEWPELADKIIPQAVRDTCLGWEEREALAFYSRDLFKEKRYAKYHDSHWDQYAWERAMQNVTSGQYYVINARYGKSTLDWTRVFLCGMNLLPYMEYYRQMEACHKDTAFTPAISRPLALPLLVQNFECLPNAEWRNKDFRTGQMHRWHGIESKHIDLLLEMIMEAQYGNRDFFLGIVLPKMKCPERVAGNNDIFWKKVGEILETKFSKTESKVMNEFAAKFKIDLEKGLQ